MKPLTSMIIASVFALTAVTAGEIIIKDSQAMDCFVYTPDPIVAETTYQLVVGVHGADGQGNGAAGMKDWAKRGDVIVIGPSFETKGERPYQNGDGVHAEKLIELFETLKKDYKLHDKMFLHGFSGGSQFVHRFAMLHPDHVCGVSAHSGGTWATDGYGEISAAAKKSPSQFPAVKRIQAKRFPKPPSPASSGSGSSAMRLNKSVSFTSPHHGPRTGIPFPPAHGIWRNNASSFPPDFQGSPRPNKQPSAAIGKTWRM